MQKRSNFFQSKNIQATSDLKPVQQDSENDQDQPLSQGAPSSETPTRNKNTKPESGILPVTIRQILGSTKINVTTVEIDGVEVNVVSLIGTIVNIVNESNRIKLEVNDGTGTMVAYFYMNECEAINQSVLDLRKHQYVHIIGGLSNTNNVTVCGAYRVLPVIDHNQITHHLLESLYLHLYAKQVSNVNTNSIPANNNNSYTTTTSGGLGNQGGFSINVDDISTEEARSVFKILMHSPTSSSTVFNRLQSQFTMHQLNTAFDFLLSEGYIHSINNDIYAVVTDQLS